MRIRHVAVVVSDLEKSAAFYEDVLDFKRLGPRTPGSYPGQALDLTDGEINFSLLRPNPDIERQNWSHSTIGPNHVGIQVDNIDAVQKKLEQQGIETNAHTYIDKDPNKGVSYFKFRDRDGAEVDVSRTAWNIHY